MKLLTSEMLIADIANRFKSVHYDAYSGTWRKLWNEDRGSEQVYRQLCELTPPTAETVAAIIGDDAWRWLTCSLCQSAVSKVIVIDVTGGEYESLICPDCIRKMLTLAIEPPSQDTANRE